MENWLYKMHYGIGKNRIFFIEANTSDEGECMNMQSYLLIYEMHTLRTLKCIALCNCNASLLIDL